MRAMKIQAPAFFTSLARLESFIAVPDLGRRDNSPDPRYLPMTTWTYPANPGVGNIAVCDLLMSGPN